MTKKVSDKKYLLGLSLIPGLGSRSIKVLLDHLGSAEEIWKINEKSWRTLKIDKDTKDAFLVHRTKINLEKELESLQKSQIDFLTIGDLEYPKLLAEIYDPPAVLYIKGILDPQSLKIAMVGTRLMTTYGHQMTSSLARELSARGLTIVSGLARGVDALAHSTTLETGGKTIAVLGSGLNFVYPPENKHLAEEIASSGAVISEYPPSSPPARGTFPSRNRIISGLSVGVVVTEAGEDSGSLITANSATDQGRIVFSVPGPVLSRQSSGTNNLIKLGAKLVTGVEDILDELNLEKVASFEMVEVTPANELEEKILANLTVEPAHIDDLARLAKLPVAEVGGALTVMVISGKVSDLGGSFYAKKH